MIRCENGETTNDRGMQDVGVSVRGRLGRMRRYISLGQCDDLRGHALEACWDSDHLYRRELHVEEIRTSESTQAYISDVILTFGRNSHEESSF